MRNAAAQFDDDFAFQGSTRDASARKPKARPRSVTTRKQLAKRPRTRKTPYVQYAAVSLSAALAIGIVINAVALQQSRHPAPLFGKPLALTEDAPPAVVKAQAVPVATAETPKPIEQVAKLPDALMAAAAAGPVPKHASAAQHPHHVVGDNPPPVAAKTKPDDLIGKLLKTSAATGEKPKETTKESAKAILATQHALMKLGFVIKPSGIFGPATRAAIEAFERDQHLPVKGEMSRKILKQLSAESGVAID